MGSGSVKRHATLNTLETAGAEVKTYLPLTEWWWKLEFSININRLELAIVQYERDRVQFWYIKDLQGI